jgi:hypothetical protein
VARWWEGFPTRYAWVHAVLGPLSFKCAAIVDAAVIMTPEYELQLHPSDVLNGSSFVACTPVMHAPVILQRQMSCKSTGSAWRDVAELAG